MGTLLKTVDPYRHLTSVHGHADFLFRTSPWADFAMYQSWDERADRGTGKGADSGGGWINGRGDEQMTMLEGYGHIVTCFTGLEWWKMDPHDELVDQGAYCLAEPGRQYLVYLPAGKPATV